MKKLFYLIPFLLLLGNIYAQQSPEFSFQLYFEDAAGNKDTITLGYDSMATDSIDTAFGETNIIGQPWDSTFEVRVGDRLYLTIPQHQGPTYSYWPINWLKNSNLFLTKKQILNYSCNSNLRSDTVSIQFTTKDLPIIIRWDGSLFQNKCGGFSGLYGGQLWSSSDLSNGRFLRGEEHITVEINKKVGTDSLFLFYSSNPLFPIPIYKIGIDSIGIIQFIFENELSASLMKNTFENVSIYPNPVKNILYIKRKNNINLRSLTLNLFTLDGRLVKQKEISKNEGKLNLKGIGNGIYILKLYNSKKILIETKKLLIE